MPSTSGAEGGEQASVEAFHLGLQPVEILHVDTAGSQRFFDSLEVNPSEKCDCQKLLFDLFSECCQQWHGFVAANWAGDGGHAFFPATQKSGNSVQAAKLFLSKLPVLAQQTATILDRVASIDLARRRFRIKAHFGLVRLTLDSKFDAGNAREFDAFLKHERNLAPVSDELFITEQLREQLGGPEKSHFHRHRDAASYGALQTSLYRLATQPTNHARKLLEGGLRPQDITDSEWAYLRSQLRSQRINVKARNMITTGLLKALPPNSGGRIAPELMVDLTLRAVYNYLRTVYPHYNFRISLWRPTAANQSEQKLQKVANYPGPSSNPTRAISLNDIQFQVVRAFNSCTPVVTQCVDEARLRGEWVDFDPPSTTKARSLQSTADLPVYRVRNQVGDFVDMERLAVLSIDSDKPDFFLKEETDLWTEDLVGFLANLALAEHIRAVGLTG